MVESKADKIKRVRKEIKEIGKRVQELRLEEMKLDSRINRLYDTLSSLESSK